MRLTGNAGIGDAATIALVAGVVGGVPIFMGASAIVERIAYSKSGLAAEAVVLQSERRWLRELASPIRRRQFYSITYEFRTANGALVQARGTYTQSSGFSAPEAGRKIRVYYLPDDPGSSYVVDQDTLFDAVLFVGFGFLVWGGSAWYAWKRRKKRSLTGQPPGS